MNSQDILSIFVDESGNFSDTKDPARYCIITFVFHNQNAIIDRFVNDLNRANEDLGLDASTFQFHTGPLIRQEDQFEAMSRRMRARIFDRMLTFVRNVDFRYRSFILDTKYVNSADQIRENFKAMIIPFMQAHKEYLESLGRIKLYYDAGQKQVGKIIQESLRESVSCDICFAEGVKQTTYKLLQVADLVCTVDLINRKLSDDMSMTKAETRFFGGPRDFKRNIVKKIKAKELEL